jgi:phosphopentomutase
MPVIQRVILIVLDSVGVGALPDAEQYGDAGSNTLANTARAVGGLRLPHLGRLGLGRIADIPGVPPDPAPAGAFGRMAEASAGKDTTIGHWELMGIHSPTPLPTYPRGFPPEILVPFEKAIGRGTLGNVPASGTEIIEELGAEHMRTGKPIVYTSADSVFQIAAHEEVIPIEELYSMCRTARSLLAGEHNVGRVIARPFAGALGSFARTERRKDFSAPPPGPTVLDNLTAAGVPVIGIGKIEDVFAGRGITEAVHTKNNADGLNQIVAAMERVERGLLFANLVDFDMVYGHRNNAQGYARALEEVDAGLPSIQARLRAGDALMLTADHGCDPTTASTDHSREYVPLLVSGPRIRAGVDLGTRAAFADLGATVAEWLGAAGTGFGASFADEVRLGE